MRVILALCMLILKIGVQTAYLDIFEFKPASAEFRRAVKANDEDAMRSAILTEEQVIAKKTDFLWPLR